MFGPRRPRRPGRGNHPSGDFWDPELGALVPGRDSGYYGHGDMGHVPGPEFYPDPYSGGVNIGRNHDFSPYGGGNRSGRNNTNESSISVMNDNGHLQVFRDGQLVSSRGSDRQGDRGHGGGSISVMNDNGHLQVFRDGQLVAGGGGGRRSGRSGRGPRRCHGHGGRHGGSDPFGFDFEDIPPGIFDDSDFSDYPFDSVGQHRGGPTGRPGLGEDPYSGQRGRGASGGNNNTRGPQADGGGYDDDDDDDEGENENELAHQGQFARHDGRGRYGGHTIRTADGCTVQFYRG